MFEHTVDKRQYTLDKRPIATVAWGVCLGIWLAILVPLVVIGLPVAGFLLLAASVAHSQ